MADLITLEEHHRLLENGWRFRFTAEEPRVSEMKEFYEDMGLETLVRTGIVDDGADCKCCFNAEGFQDRFKTVYTRGIKDNFNRFDEEMY